MARGIVHELGEIGVEESNVHVVGQTTQELEAAHVPAAIFLQVSELIETVIRGILLGCIFSTFIFLLFYLMPPMVHFSPLGIFAIILFGMGFGIWASGMIAVSRKKAFLEKYAKYVEAGHFILMADVPADRENEITTRVMRHHVGAQLASHTLH